MAAEKAESPPPNQDEDALSILVNQFSDPMSFVRELVQNSIDAGSVEIDVYCEWKPIGDGERGTAIIHVDDYGEGMDRTIIETKLTRLFSSDKEGDLTKIGKFGIGFVSVFAVQPDAVCLDTGRSGESFRVLFRKDRTFSLLKLREPVEGTKIQVIKQMAASEYPLIEQRVNKALSFHCKHVEVALNYAGQPITEAFDLPDALLKVTEKDDLAELVVGIMPPDVKTLAGFYNRGLTLLENPTDLACVSYKIRSTYLEHTLSRDNIVHDENYARVMALLDRAVRGPLLTLLMKTIDGLYREQAARDEIKPYLAGLASLIEMGCKVPSECAACVVATSPLGTTYTLAQLIDAANELRLVHATERTPLVEGLIESKGAVCLSWQAALPDAIYRAGFGGWKPPKREDDAKDEEVSSDIWHIERCFARALPFSPRDEATRTRREALQQAIKAMLAIGGEDTEAVAIERLNYDGSGGSGKLAVVVRGEALSASPIAKVAGELKGTLVVNAEHPQLQPVLTLCDREPELAAYTLLKLHLLGQMTAARDSALFAGAMEARCRRMKS